MPRSHQSRVQQLAKRVGWLDRYRRKIAALVTIAISPLIFMKVYDLMGTSGDWPKIYALVVGLAILSAVWAIAEVALAWIAAVWETELSEKTRDGELPRAIIRK